MAFGSFIFDELKISNSCYMAAAIEFNYAMFHIFSGPLFANLEGYAFLDLLIWGVSPIFFQLVRTPLKRQIRPLLKEDSQNYSKLIVRRRFGWLLLCFVAVFVSYLFMNYSSTFRWNYFSRIINLDFGYLLFDLACRCMEVRIGLIVQIEEEEQQKMLIDQNHNTLQPIFHRGGYCKYRNIFMMASYFLVFYLSTLYDTNDQGVLPPLSQSGQEIFTALSILSCIFTLTIPFLYLFKYRGQNYSIIEQQQQREREEVQIVSVSQYSESDKRVYAVFILTSFAHFVNTSYFSLWVMEGLSKDGENTYKQFNKTLFISSAFFLAASFLLFVVAHLYIGCKVKNGRMGDTNTLVKAMKPFLIGYGLLIIAVFVHSRHQWQSMVVPIIPFAFVNLIVNVYTDQVDEWKQQDKKRYGYHRLNFLIETVAYLAIPAILTIMGLGDEAVHIYGYLSAASLIGAGLLMESRD